MTGGRLPAGVPSESGDMVAADRPWLSHGTGLLGRDRIRRWRLAIDAESEEAEPHGLSSAAGGHLPPGISVIVLSVGGRGSIDRCLCSLARQTLAHELFEIVVIDDLADRSGPTVAAFRCAYPSIRVRLLRLAVANTNTARDAGIAAAGRRYTTFIHGDDFVSDSFLETLVTHAGPTVVPVTPIVDLAAGLEDTWSAAAPEGVAVTASEPQPTRAPAVRDRSGELLMASELRSATTLEPAKAVATDLLREIMLDPESSGLDTIVFWSTVVVRGHIVFYKCLAATGATYYRVADRPHRRGGIGDFEIELAERLRTVAGLDRLRSRTDAASVDLVEAHARACLAPVGDHLTSFPADHERVVAALDRTPVLNISCEVMNRPLTKGLVIAYAFPPYADASAMVMAKRLRSRGQVADVISNAMDSMRRLDVTGNAICGPYVSRLAKLPTPSHFERWRAIERFGVKGMETATRWTEDTGAYEWLYSRAHFAASHLLAAAYKLYRPAIRWTAEFSDPLSRDVLNQERGAPVEPGPFFNELKEGMTKRGLPLPASANSLVWCEEVTYALADEIVFTNESQLTHMLSYCSNPDVSAMVRQKAVVSPHPTLPSHFYSMFDYDYPLRPDAVHLAYFGKFYANRGLDDVLGALADLDHDKRRHVRLHVFTRKPAMLLSRAGEFGVEGCVRAGPYVRYLEFLGLLAKFDCLIATDAVTKGSHPRNPYLPSKWSDYRGSGTPVWGVIETGSPLSGEPLDYASPIGDVAAAGTVLASVLTAARARRPGGTAWPHRPVSLRDRRRITRPGKSG